MERQQMTNKAVEHQANELAQAIASTINVERTKARLDVQAIIRDGLDTGASPTAILSQIIDWTGK